MSALSVTLSILANRRFLTLLVRSTNSTNVLVTSLNLHFKTSASKKGADKRLFLYSLFYLACLTGSLHSIDVQAAACPAIPIDETTEIRYIHDGDTIHLKDGRKLRLIGINTPELARDNKPAEAFALDARQALESIFRYDSSIALVYGKNNRDRYGRLLAHAFTGEGDNVQLALLHQGYARAITFPPNTRYTECYLEAETQAICNKAGMWQKTRPVDAAELSSRDTGFQLVKGRVKDIKTNKKGTWINLEDKLTVGIRTENQALFDHETIKSYLNKSLTVRGWVNHGKYDTPYYMRVRHPGSLQLSSSLRCK